MPPRKSKKPVPADPAAQPPPAVHIQASATVGQAESTQVTGAIVNAPDAQHIQIGDRVAGDKVLGDLVFGDKNVSINQLPTTPALHQLRAPVGDFVGREQEIAELVQAARSGAVAAISGVRGMGGIGKTELAYVVAQQLVGDFSDAQLVVDLRGASDLPLSPVQALQKVIHAFEPERRLGDDLAELQAIYRSLLSGKRMLILADDARDAAQVRPLLPPPGSALLVTSRYRFDLEGMATLDLSTLPPGQAIDLLRTLCPRITTEAEAIARLCGYLPLALRVVAGLIKRTTRAVAEYVTLLEDTHTRLARMRDLHANLDVEASLTLSYDALDPLAQHLLCQLAIFPASFDRFAAEQIVTLPADGDLADLLDSLHAVYLVDYDPERERYDLHDLVRVFARARLDAGMAEALMLRYAQHYEQIARQAQKLYLQGGESVPIGLGLFDRERAHVDAGWAWLLGQRTEPAIDDLLIAYADATVHIGDFRYDVRRERVPQLEAALAAAERREHHADQGRLLGNLGVAYALLGEMQQAIELYEQRLVIARELGDRRGEGQTLGNLGLAYGRLGQMRQAIELHEQDLMITRELDDRRGESEALGNLGLACARLGEVPYAINYFEQHLGIARELGDRRGEGTALGNLGLAYARLGEAQQAIDYYKQHLEIAREVGDRRGEADALGGLAVAYAQSGEIQYAIDYFERQLAMSRAIGDRRGEVYGSWNLGKFLLQQGDLARAITLMQVLVDYEHSIGHPDTEADAALVAGLRAQLQLAEQDADLLQRAEAAVARALTEGSAEERAALAERLIVTADAYASGDAAERALAAQVRGLLERLASGEDITQE